MGLGKSTVIRQRSKVRVCDDDIGAGKPAVDNTVNDRDTAGPIAGDFAGAVPPKDAVMDLGIAVLVISDCTAKSTGVAREGDISKDRITIQIERSAAAQGNSSDIIGYIPAKGNICQRGVGIFIQHTATSAGGNISAKGNVGQDPIAIDVRQTTASSRGVSAKEDVVQNRNAIFICRSRVKRLVIHATAGPTVGDVASKGHIVQDGVGVDGINTTTARRGVVAKSHIGQCGTAIVDTQGRAGGIDEQAAAIRTCIVVADKQVDEHWAGIRYKKTAAITG